MPDFDPAARSVQWPLREWVGGDKAWVAAERTLLGRMGRMRMMESGPSWSFLGTGSESRFSTCTGGGTMYVELCSCNGHGA